MADTPQITVEMLRDNRLFQGLSTSILQKLVDEIEPETAGPGENLISEGELSSHMFVIVHGELEVLAKGGGDRDVRVALLGPGDWVGEMTILDIQPRSATVRALAPTLMLRLTSGDVKRLLYQGDLEQYALMLMNIARELSRRLRVADRLIAQASGALASQYVEQSMRPPPKP